jgi:hypothetical protein
MCDSHTHGQAPGTAMAVLHVERQPVAPVPAFDLDDIVDVFSAGRTAPPLSFSRRLRLRFTGHLKDDPEPSLSESTQSDNAPGAPVAEHRKQTHQGFGFFLECIPVHAGELGPPLRNVRSVKIFAEHQNELGLDDLVLTQAVAAFRIRAAGAAASAGGRDPSTPQAVGPRCLTSSQQNARTGLMLQASGAIAKGEPESRPLSTDDVQQFRDRCSRRRHRAKQLGHSNSPTA